MNTEMKTHLPQETNTGKKELEIGCVDSYLLIFVSKYLMIQRFEKTCFPSCVKEIHWPLVV